MIKKGSNVKVLGGKDKNKTGEIIELDRKRNRAKIKGITMIKRHLKTTKARKKYNAHDEENKFKIGDKVTIRESRPFSKNKKFEVIGANKCYKFKQN